MDVPWTGRCFHYRCTYSRNPYTRAPLVTSAPRTMPWELCGRNDMRSTNRYSSSWGFLPDTTPAVPAITGRRASEGQREPLANRRPSIVLLIVSRALGYVSSRSNSLLIGSQRGLQENDERHPARSWARVRFLAGEYYVLIKTGWLCWPLNS